MLNLSIKITGKNTGDLDDAIAEVKHLVNSGFLSGHDSNDDGSFHFDIQGRSHVETENQKALFENET